MIRCEGVTAGYGRGDILRGVTLSCPGGTTLAVLGPNGSGKSTLLRCMSRTLKPTGGSVFVGDSDVWQMSQSESARRIAVVPQQEDTIFRFAVRDVVAMGRYAWGTDDQARVDGALEEAGCTALADRPMSELSGGERQRVLLARAIAQDSAVLLLDEPTAHMDIGYQIATLGRLKQLASDGKAIVAVLHDLNLAAGLADFAILLHNGVVEAEGTVEDVLRSEAIEQVYGSRFSRVTDPLTGRTILSPEFVPSSQRSRRPRRVHVIGGGGSAAPVLTELWQLGHKLSLGVAHGLDSDLEAAVRLHIPTVSAPPFTRLEESDISEAGRLAADAEVVLVCPAPYGQGNLANLMLAERLLELGKKLLLARRGDEQWDFTEGEAAEVWSRILASGAELYDANETALALDSLP